MASSSITTCLIDGRDYPELPKGVQRWTAQSEEITGLAAATSTTFNFDVNPQSNEDFQKYVTISSLVIMSGTAAINVLTARVRAEAASWEDHRAGRVRGLAAVPMLNYYDAANFVGATNDPIYLGRSVKGTPGRFSVVLEEVLNTTYDCYATGFISDTPMLAPNFWKS